MPSQQQQKRLNFEQPFVTVIYFFFACFHVYMPVNVCVWFCRPPRDILQIPCWSLGCRSYSSALVFRKCCLALGVKMAPAGGNTNKKPYLLFWYSVNKCCINRRVFSEELDKLLEEQFPPGRQYAGNPRRLGDVWESKHCLLAHWERRDLG